MIRVETYFVALFWCAISFIGLIFVKLYNMNGMIYTLIFLLGFIIIISTGAICSSKTEEDNNG